MAINIKNYVDISTVFPSASTTARSYGGLVFTAAEMVLEEDAPAELREAKETYDAGGVCFLSLEEVMDLFGKYKSDSTRAINIMPTIVTTDEEADKYTDEYRFALGYYSYMTPTGRTASRLAFSKVMSDKGLLGDFMRVNEITNMFGSFTFLSSGGGSSSTSSSAEDSDIQSLLEVASYNQSLKTKYLFVVNRVRGEATASEVVEECKLFKDIVGTVYVSGQSDASAYMPMAILGSTDFENGSVVNYMFKQFTTEVPSVFDDDTYLTLSSAYVNFYGRSQTNGQTLDFYQRGFNTNGIDTSIYCNEMWFKAACESALMNMLISEPRIPADSQGVSLVQLEVADICSQAVTNGMFMPKQTSLTDRRNISEIVEQSGGTIEKVESIITDVSVSGYAIYAYLDEGAPSGELPTEKYIEYYVFYGTADSIRYIKGNNILIK